MSCVTSTADIDPLPVAVEENLGPGVVLHADQEHLLQEGEVSCLVVEAVHLQEVLQLTDDQCEAPLRQEQQVTRPPARPRLHVLQPLEAGPGLVVVIDRVAT